MIGSRVRCDLAPLCSATYPRSQLHERRSCERSPPACPLPCHGALLLISHDLPCGLCARLAPSWLCSSLNSATSRSATAWPTAVLVITAGHPLLASMLWLPHGPSGLPPGPLASHSPCKAGVLGLPLRHGWLRGLKAMCPSPCSGGISTRRSAVHLINCPKPMRLSSPSPFFPLCPLLQRVASPSGLGAQGRALHAALGSSHPSPAASHLLLATRKLAPQRWFQTLYPPPCHLPAGAGCPTCLDVRPSLFASSLTSAASI